MAPFPGAGAQVGAAAASASDGVSGIEVAARRIGSFERTSSARTFGRLTFRGGLVLTSPSPDFGGFSGLILDREGRDFVAVTDEGHWMSARIAYDGTAPSGIEGARMGTIRARSGAALTRKREKDCEAIALAEGTLQRGVVLMAFERLHRIGRFPVERGVIGAPLSYLTMPAEARQMRSNSGFEAVTMFSGGPNKGRVIAFSERFHRDGGQHVGWIWVDGQPRRFEMTEKNGCDVTDCVSLDDGTLVVLERRFRWTEGVKMQLRLVRPDEVRAGATVKGEILFSGGMQYDIDNMEALGVSRDTSGRVVLTLMSDNNFNNFLQRTILLQFTLGAG
ncbi:MAG TPA: esterase-like activity of phytase family protein [Hyphomicrobiaceae bacterium]|nr:esterase-like activity of phytase family protein [Hyphomicrobiaceae bacterium]